MKASSERTTSAGSVGEVITSSNDDEVGVGKLITNTGDDGGKVGARVANTNGDDSESSKDEFKITLNTASKPAGQSRKEKSVKKAKKRKEFEETKACVQQTNTYGEITLSDLRDCVQKKKLPMEKGESVFKAIRSRHEDAIYKRPKGHVATPGTTKTIETTIRYVLQRFSSEIPNSKMERYRLEQSKSGHFTARGHHHIQIWMLVHSLFLTSIPCRNGIV
ncbi:hypothetical protein GQ600_6171 [Phytophthora cactorum]|nr:hypothetical protein GQ600_6171 [Phytophthora cactorum]